MIDLFKNFKVIELSSVLAGPSVGMFFAELGADVIKVENAKTNGDVTRSWKLKDETNTDLSSYFCSVNWGKRSIALNFEKEGHYKILLQLIEKADLVIVSFKPGDEKKHKLDYDSLKSVNSKLLYAHITGFGLNDERVAFDAVLQAYCGFTYINGTKESGPTKMPVALIDVLAAHQIKEAILLAYINKLTKNEGAYINCSLLQSGISSLVNQATNYLIGNIIPEAVGSDHPNIVPYGTAYKTKDQKLLVLAVGNDKQFDKLCSLLKLNYLIESEKYTKNHQRVKNKSELNIILSDEIIKYESKTIIKMLNDNKIPAAIVLNMQEVFEQEAAKELLLNAYNEENIIGVKSFCAEINNSKTNSKLLPPPKYNQHYIEILKHELNFTDEEISNF